MTPKGLDGCCLDTNTASLWGSPLLEARMITKRSGVYLIKNETSGKVYVGSAVNLSKRWSEHLCGLRKGTHCNEHLKRAWNRYGEDAFSFEVLLICDKDNLLFFEQRVLNIFAKHHGWGMLYNISPTAGSSIGVKFTDETKAKIGASSKGRNIGRRHTDEELKKMSVINIGRNVGRRHSDEARHKMSQSRRGKKFSEEHKANLSAALMGRQMSSETMEKLRIANLGRHHSESAKAKIGAASKGSKLGRKLSVKTRAKMSTSHKGIKLSEEHKEKMRAGWARRRTSSSS